MGPLLKDPTNMRACHCGIFPVVALLCTALFIGSTLISSDSKEGIFRFGNADSVKKSGNCKIHCKPTGSEALPRGIISRDSDLEFRPLWGSPVKKRPASNVKSLLAIAVGIRQRDVVNDIIERFTTDNFTIMLFHYDGVVDEWRDLHWMDSAIHVSAINQTKWWFAKRFLHPDIVSEYSYIFLWDEDIDVKNFHPGRYLSIVQEEGLEISQPALDATNKSEVHHMITIRGRRAKVHRRMYKFKGGGRCYENSTAPPCTGWVEMMAPVFSKAAWRCVWHMIQNDLIHAWGLDMKLGYCAQGDRTKNVGVVDAEYIVHKAIPTLGGLDEKKQVNSQPPIWSSQSQNLTDARAQIRLRSSEEFDIFRKRWQKAVMEDKCWADPYAESKSKNNR